MCGCVTLGVDTQDDFAHLSDRVQFGDVVQRPPELKAAPKKASVDDARSRVR